MIAHDSRGTPEDARVLSAALADRLRLAIRARWHARSSAQAEEATLGLAAALADAAAEARERALRPEDLILAIKALEAEAGAQRSDLTPGQRRALRAWLVSACIRAYFAAA